MVDIFALVVLLAVLFFTDAPLKAKLVLVAVSLGIWGLTWLSPWFYLALLIHGACVYFLFFGSQPGRRWRR
jgi:hypothetical protein